MPVTGLRVPAAIDGLDLDERLPPSQATAQMKVDRLTSDQAGVVGKANHLGPGRESASVSGRELNRWRPSRSGPDQVTSLSRSRALAPLRAALAGRIHVRVGDRDASQPAACAAATPCGASSTAITGYACSCAAASPGTLTARNGSEAGHHVNVVEPDFLTDKRREIPTSGC